MLQALDLCKRRIILLVPLFTGHPVLCYTRSQRQATFIVDEKNDKGAAGVEEIPLPRRFRSPFARKTYSHKTFFLFVARRRGTFRKNGGKRVDRRKRTFISIQMIVSIDDQGTPRCQNILSTLLLKKDPPVDARVAQSEDLRIRCSRSRGLKREIFVLFTRVAERIANRSRASPRKAGNALRSILLWQTCARATLPSRLTASELLPRDTTRQLVFYQRLQRFASWNSLNCIFGER